MKYYDSVISLGASCYTAILLKKLGLQGASNVFDWSGGNLFDKCGIGGFEGKINLILQHFDNAFNINDLEMFDRVDTAEIKKPVRNKRTGLQYIHDFPKDKSIEDEFPHYRDKYQRRIDRLYHTIENSNSILFLFILQGSVLPMEEMQKAEAKINEIFSNKIDFMIIQNIDNGERQEIFINEHLKLILWPKVFINDKGKFNPEFETYLNRNIVTKYKIEYLQTATQNLTKQIHTMQKFLSDENLIKSSEYFDADWYSKTYSLKEGNLALHYLTTGYKQNMNPSLKFDGNKYLEINLDVKQAGMNPLLHYLRYGQSEGRKEYKVANNGE